MLNRRLIHHVLLLAAIVLSVAVFAAGQAKIPPELHMVAMRDGTKLATDVYLPPDTNAPCPVVLMRTPYGRAGGSGEGGVVDSTRHPGRAWSNSVISSFVNRLSQIRLSHFDTSFRTS